MDAGVALCYRGSLLKFNACSPRRLHPQPRGQSIPPRLPPLLSPSPRTFILAKFAFEVWESVWERERECVRKRERERESLREALIKFPITIVTEVFCQLAPPLLLTCAEGGGAWISFIQFCSWSRIARSLPVPAVCPLSSHIDAYHSQDFLMK